MRAIGLDELRTLKETKEAIGWVLPWLEEPLMHCFQFLALELEPFEKFFSDGAACLLVSGAGSIDGRQIQQNTSFGVREEDGKYRPAPAWFRAEEKSILFCFNTNIFHNVCFGMGCGGMHTRIREMVISAMAVQ